MRSLLILIFLFSMVAIGIQPIWSQTDGVNDKIDQLKEQLSHQTPGSVQARIKNIALGELYLEKNKYNLALKCFEKAKIEHASSKDTLQFHALIGLGKIFTRQGYFSKAQSQYVSALEIANATKNKRFKATTWNLIGVIHWKEGKNDLAKQAYNQSIQLRYALKDSIGLAEVYNNLGIIYKLEKQYHSALSLYDKALGIRRRRQDSTGVSQTLFNIGSVKNEMGNHEEALAYYEESFQLKTILGNDYGKLPHYLNVGAIYSDLKDYDQSEENFLTGLALAQQLGANDYIMSFYRELAFSYHRQGNHEEAYRYHVLYMETKDAIINQQNADKLAELQVQYKTREKQQYIERLKLVSQLDNEKLNKEKYFNYGLLTFILIGILIVAMILYNGRKLKRANSLLQEQKQIVEQRGIEKEMLAREMHHRVKNNLQLTSSLLKLQARNLVDEEAKQALHEAKSRIGAISIIHQHLYAVDDLSSINLENYLPELCHVIFKSHQLPDQAIELRIEVIFCPVSIDSAMSIGLFVNEALMNAIKHAFSDGKGGQIHIEFAQYGSDFVLRIADNGKGIPQLTDMETFGNFGFQLLRSFAKKLGGKMEVFQREGTLISLIIPAKAIQNA